MLAAPLWAASHALPDGEGFAGDRAKQGYMLLINVAMRPVLLTIGFILSLGMMWALTWMGSEIMSGAARVMLLSVDTTLFDGSNIGERVANNVTTALNNIQMSTIGTIAVLLIGGAVMVMLIHRAFDLMYESADEVMQWVGGGVKQLGGEKENAQRTTAIISGQFGRMEGRTRGLSGPKMPGVNKPGAGNGNGGGGVGGNNAGGNNAGNQTGGDPGAHIGNQANAAGQPPLNGGEQSGGGQGDTKKYQQDGNQ